MTRFHKDGKRAYLETNKGDADLSRLVLLDPETGKEEVVGIRSAGQGGLRQRVFSETTDELVGTSYEDERTRLYFRDKAYEADYKLLQQKLPGRDVSVGSTTADDQLWFVTARSDVDPGARYLFDRKTRGLTLQYKMRERIPREHMASVKPIRYPSSDGLEIPAFLTLPKGVPAKGLPLIVRAARRALGARQLGLRQPRPVPGQPRLRRPPAELPRLHRLRQEVPQRRQQAMGRPDAGRHHLGREAPGRPGHRRSQARRHHGRLLRRLRDPGRRRLHARPVRGRRSRSSAPPT